MDTALLHDRFANWLREYHRGKNSAINARDMRQWGNRREIRLMTHKLRTQGVPICSGNEGYYYAATQRELEQTLGFLESMDQDLQKAIHGLRGTRSQMR